MVSRHLPPQRDHELDVELNLGPDKHTPLSERFRSLAAFYSSMAKCIRIHSSSLWRKLLKSAVCDPTEFDSAGWR